METESRPLPADVIPSIASSMSRRHRTIAILQFVVAGLLTLVLLSPYLDPDHHWKHPGHKPIAGTIVAIVIFAGGSALAGARRIMSMRLARRVAQCATDPALKWFLNGNVIVAADERGVPRPDLSLVITKTLQLTLTAVPRATAVSTSSHRDSA